MCERDHVGQHVRADGPAQARWPCDGRLLSFAPSSRSPTADCSEAAPPKPEVERPVKWLESRPGLRLFAVVVWERSTWSARSTPVFGRARTNDVDRDEPSPQPWPLGSVRRARVVGGERAGTRVDRRTATLRFAGWLPASLRSAGRIPHLRRPSPVQSPERCSGWTRSRTGMGPATAVSRHVHDGSGRPADPEEADHLLGKLLQYQAIISAHKNPASSRATAVTTTLRVSIRFARRWKRPHNRCCAFHDRAIVSASTRRCRLASCTPMAGTCR